MRLAKIRAGLLARVKGLYQAVDSSNRCLTWPCKQRLTRVSRPGIPLLEVRIRQRVDDELIDVLLDFVARMPLPASGVGLQQLHGAAGRVDPSATAFAYRGDRHDC